MQTAFQSGSGLSQKSLIIFISRLSVQTDYIPRMTMKRKINPLFFALICAFVVLTVAISLKFAYSNAVKYAVYLFPIG